MKYLLLVASLLFFTSTQAQYMRYSQKDQAVLISADYAESHEKPLVISGYEKFVYQGDSIYLVNPRRMSFYRALHENVTDTIDFKSFLRRQVEFSLSQDSLFHSLVQLNGIQQVKSAELLAKSSDLARQLEFNLGRSSTELNQIRLRLSNLERLQRKTKRVRTLQTLVNASLVAVLAYLAVK